MVFLVEVEILNGSWGRKVLLPTKLRILSSYKLQSQSAGAKLRAQKGNSPDRQLRSQNLCSVEKDVYSPKQSVCWLRSSHQLKSA